MKTSLFLRLSAAATVALVGCSSSSGTPPGSDAASGDSSDDGGVRTDVNVDAEDAVTETAGGDASEAADGGEGGISVEAGEGGAIGCTGSGGTVATEQCCLIEVGFPSNCVVGACGCSPTNSHAIQVCNCPTGQCFDGTACRSR